MALDLRKVYSFVEGIFFFV